MFLELGLGLGLCLEGKVGFRVYRGIVRGRCSGCLPCVAAFGVLARVPGPLGGGRRQGAEDGRTAAVDVIRWARFPDRGFDQLLVWVVFEYFGSNAHPIRNISARSG